MLTADKIITKADRADGGIGLDNTVAADIAVVIDDNISVKPAISANDGRESN